VITQQKLKEILEYDAELGIFRWKVRRGGRAAAGDIAGTLNRYGYLDIQIDNKKYKSHRLAWLFVYGVMPHEMIDHINAVKTDNRLKNLRLATNSQNQQNQRNPQINNTSGYLGVSFHKSNNCFVAHIKIDGKSKHLGCFNTAELAYEAYLLAKRQAHGFCTI
jgi:hypothetical protein